MDKSDIIRMAKEAGITVALENFARLVAAHERGELAKLIDYWQNHTNDEFLLGALSVMANAVEKGNFDVSNIRQRGDKPL